MKGKAAKKEEVDLSTLPKANMVVSSLLLNFKNQDNKFKIFESFYKGLQNDPLYFFITREHIIDYAKEQKIYEDLSDPKSKNPKEPSAPKKDITPEQLSKACLGLLIEKSIPCRKDKKIIFDQIEEAMKKREESEKYWNNKMQTNQNLTQNDEAPKEEKKKKGRDKNKNKKVQQGNEVAPPKPEEIEIPKYDEYTNEIFIILYNYPLSKAEYECLINETNEQNDKIIINLFQFVNDIDEFVEQKKDEVVLDKKGKPVQKEVKLDKDAAEMQRFFLSTLVLPPHPKSPETLAAEEEARKKAAEEEAKKKEEEATGAASKPKAGKGKADKTGSKEQIQEEALDDGMEPTPLILNDVFNDFKQLRDNSNRDSNIRKACFESEDFSYKVTNESEKEDTANLFYKNFLIKLAKIHAQMVYFEEWKKNYEIIKLEEEGETVKTFDEEKIQNINADIIYGKDSIGRSLLSFVHYLVNENRKEERNQLIYHINNFEGQFEKNFEKYRYAFFETPKENVANVKDNKKRASLEPQQKKEEKEQQQQNLNNDFAIVLQSHPKK